MTIGECRPGVTVFNTELCPGPSSTTVADATGHISTIAIVGRWFGDGLTVTDCATSVGACTFRATTDPSTFYVPDPTEVARVPLGFDPSTTLPSGPPVSVTPKTGLSDRQAVTVAGSGFPGGDRIAIVPCRTAATFTPGDCDTTAPVTFLADGSGAFSQSYRVPQFFLSSRSATVDCAAATPTCMLAIVDYADSTIATFVPVTFADARAEPCRQRQIADHHRTHRRQPQHEDRHRSSPRRPTTTSKCDTKFRSRRRGPRRSVTTPTPLAPRPSRRDRPSCRSASTSKATVVMSPTSGSLSTSPTRWAQRPAPTRGSRSRTTTRRRRCGSPTQRCVSRMRLRYALVPVRLSVGSEFPVTVHYTTHQFTARAGNDYVDTAGTLTIPAVLDRGPIAVVDPRRPRAREQQRRCSSPSTRRQNATIADGDAVLTITDDD